MPYISSNNSSVVNGNLRLFQNLKEQGEIGRKKITSKLLGMEQMR